MNEGPALKEQKKKYGPESLAILSPARRSYSEYLYRFLIAHGSPNYGHSGICAMQKMFAFTYTLGAAPWPDIPQSNLILIWGKQPSCVATCPGEALKFGALEDLKKMAAPKKWETLSVPTAPAFWISGRMSGADFLRLLAVGSALDQSEG
ncbi:MAG: hypothetical protein QUT30_18870 [Acidobacteriota bacterium]|nr:hypothetical protein [Acidobacteriota bacterium]